MQATVNRSVVLADVIGLNEGVARWVKNFLLIAVGVAALWISAKTQIATWPVPITLQVLVVMAIGAAFGSSLGFATLLTYLAVGAAGEPVFAGTPEKGIGLAYMVGPTGGYLLGFALAAWVVGWLAERGFDRNVFTMAAAMVIGLLVLYIPGVTWLCSPAGFAETYGFSGYGWENWYAYGVKTFIWVDAIKVSIAALVFPAIWSLIGRR